MVVRMYLFAPSAFSLPSAIFAGFDPAISYLSIRPSANRCRQRHPDLPEFETLPANLGNFRSQVTGDAPGG